MRKALSALATRRILNSRTNFAQAYCSMVGAETQLELLPSMRFGKLYSTMADGKKIFLSTEGQLLCEHGELASTISFWTSMEKRAKIDGTEPPPRGGFQTPSICDCMTTEGMHGKIEDDVYLPVKPSSLFEFLESSDAEVIKVKGRDARRIPHTDSPVFVSTIGTLTCRDGASRRSLIKKSKTQLESKRLPTCGCKLKALSMNSGLKGLKLGKFSKLKVPH